MGMEVQTGLKEIVIAEIRKLAEQYHLEEVILFGSRARGDYKKLSDIDLAVRGGDTVRFSLDVEEYTSTLLSFDVVDLNGPVQQELLESIRRDGRRIYEKI